MPKKRVLIKTNYDDWCEVYVEHDLVYAGHHLDFTLDPNQVQRIFKKVGVKIKIVETEEF